MSRLARILVFPCGSEVGLEIHRSFEHSPHFDLIGASSVSDHGSFVFRSYVEGIPFVNEPEFSGAISELVREKSIDLVMPAHDDAVVSIARLAFQGDLEATPVTAPLFTCMVARSKRLTYSELGGVVPTPHEYQTPELVSDSDFPVFLKPDHGQGSRGTYLVASRSELEFYVQLDPSLLILEFLPGREYTIDCFTDRHGVLRFASGRSRSRISGGISVRSEVLKDDRFNDFAERINSHLDFRGAWFFQLKEREDGELVLLEIAPRVAGTMGLTRCLGVNLPLLSAYDAIGRDVQIIRNDYQIVVDRSLRDSFKTSLTFRNVYLDLDDTLLNDGSINPKVMIFVHQCRNRDISVRLITRHSGDLKSTLEEHSLNSCFDEVIWLRSGEPKSAYITHDEAIFVDDSFAERADVSAHCRIPVFDAHMLEALFG